MWIYDRVSDHLCSTAVMPLIIPLLLWPLVACIGRRRLLATLTVVSILNVVQLYVRLGLMTLKGPISFWALGTADAPSYGWWVDYWPSWILHFCIYFGCRILYQNPVPDSGVTSDIFWTSNTGSTLLDRLNPWLSVRWAVVFFFDPAVMICFAHSTRQCISVENSADSATDPLDRTQRLNWFPVVRFDHWSRDYLWFVSALAVGLLINELNVWGLAAHDWVAAGHCGLEGFASYTNPVNLAVFASITTWYFSNLVAVLSSDAPQGVSKLIASAFRILLHFLVWLSFYNATIAIAVAILIASAVTRARSVLSPCSQS